MLNLYIVSSRVEGGPQAIYEASLCKCPIISTDVGNSNLILSSNSIYDYTKIHDDDFVLPKIDVNENYKRAIQYSIENYIYKFNQIFMVD